MIKDFLYERITKVALNCFLVMLCILTKNWFATILVFNILVLEFYNFLLEKKLEAHKTLEELLKTLETEMQQSNQNEPPNSN